MFRFNWVIKFAIGLAALTALSYALIFSLQLFSTYQEEHAYEHIEVSKDDAYAASKDPESCKPAIVTGWFVELVWLCSRVRNLRWRR